MYYIIFQTYIKNNAYWNAILIVQTKLFNSTNKHIDHVFRNLFISLVIILLVQENMEETC